MGIPSYFSHIVKEHRKILQEYKHMTVHNLYLDSNSIIYDAVRIIKNDAPDFEKLLIQKVCEKIEEYIRVIQPEYCLYIAFDGVAPVAKLDQQRNRRYKSMFEKKILIPNDNEEKEWDTTAITPGTEFMITLSKLVKKRFRNPKKYNVKEIHISSSDEHGEGEHKIYQFIRNNEKHHKESTTVIYGLDADLIMLTLNHLHIAPRMYLFRETPHFIQSIDKTLNPNSNYLLDIPEFSKALSIDLNGKNRIFDYILLCFFLGNDFLPHFPALNIRTTGIDRLLSAYRKVTNENLVNGPDIIWKNVRKVIEELAKHEEEIMKEEYKARSKLSKNLKLRKQDKGEVFNTIPLRDRTEELYINPYECGWQERYYSTLFHFKVDDERRKQVSLNYLEGLEWTLKYYTTGCVDWRWRYKYDYPPLLCDLLRYIPYFETTLVPYNKDPPVSNLVQLSYVLPKQCLYLIPGDLRKTLLREKPGWYSDNHPFCWAFCKYFWEAHAEMPDIHIDELESIIANWTIASSTYH